MQIFMVTTQCDGKPISILCLQAGSPGSLPGRRAKLSGGKESGEESLNFVLAACLACLCFNLSLFAGYFNTRQKFYCKSLNSKVF